MLEIVFWDVQHGSPIHYMYKIGLEDGLRNVMTLKE